MRKRVSTNVPRDTRESRVIRQWRASGLGEKSIATYITWVRRFRALVRNEGVDELARLTLADATAFAKKYVGARRGKRVKSSTRYVALNALHAWACALQLLGEPVPSWRPDPVTPSAIASLGCIRTVSPMPPRSLRKDFETRHRHSGRLHQVTAIAGRDIRRVRAVDIDAVCREIYVCTLVGEPLQVRVAHCGAFCVSSSRRGGSDTIFLTVSSHLATAPMRAPRGALPWEDIRRILRAVPRDRPVGLRDYAMLLVMATYGLGSGEVVHLELRDVDWQASILRVRRRKTGVPLELPLLPAVAQALAAYLRRGRPSQTLEHTIFVSLALPHRPLTTAAIRHRIREYARRAGISTAKLGAHIFRHSHATRQIDAGAPFKIVGDILGHLRPASTSVYVRVALRRLRMVALPVPR